MIDASRLMSVRVSIVVQFYPCLKSYFLLFQNYHTSPYPKRKEKKRKLKPRIKLNKNALSSGGSRLLGTHGAWRYVLLSKALVLLCYFFD